MLLFSFLLLSCGEQEKKVVKPTEDNQSQVKASTQNNPIDKLLTEDDVAKVSGIAGVKFVERNPKIGAGGDLNFSTEENKLIVMVQVVDKSQYEGFKKYYFKSDIKDLGEEAMTGATMKGMPDNNVTFRKGTKCVALTSFVNMNNMKSNMLSPEQLISLAKIIESRI